MELYGNKIWNDVIDNSQKSYFVMKQTIFNEVSGRLDANGLNYYAYSQNGVVKMAVNTYDVAYFQEAVGKALLESMDAVGTAKSNTPSPIIGTVAYKDILEKRFFSAEIDTSLKIAERLRQENIQFSGRVYEDHATLTVTSADEKRLYEIYNELINQRQQHKHKISQNMLVGNTPLKSIENRSYFTTSITPEQFLKIKPEIDQSGIAYSGVVKLDHTIITVNTQDHAAFQDLVDSISARSEILSELEQEGYSAHQIALLSDLISLYAARGREDYLPTLFEPFYTDEQLLEMAERAKVYVSQSPIDKMLDKNGILLDILQHKQELQAQYEFREALKDYHFSDAQLDALREIHAQGIAVESLLSTISEDYSAEEIRQLGIAMLSCDMDAIRALLAAHQQEQSVQCDIQDASDASVTHDLMQFAEDVQRDIPLEAAIPLEEPEPADRDTYALYRLKEGETNCTLRFMNYEYVQKHGGVEPQNYECIYSAHAEEDDTPDRIFERFNLEHPSDFTGYSLSVGDIIVQQHDGQKQALFVDSFGFKELPDFFRDRQPELKESLFALPFSDREKGVIGNTAYRFIAGKTYHKMEIAQALVLADQLAEKEIPFSAKLREDTGTATITIPAIYDSAFRDLMEDGVSQAAPDLSALEDARQDSSKMQDTARADKEEEKPDPMPARELSIGDHIQTEDQRKWAVTRIDGDFAITLENLDPADNQRNRGVYGNWKNSLKYTQISGRGIPEPPKTKRRKQSIPIAEPEEQLKLRSTEKPEAESDAARLDPDNPPTVKVEWSEHPEIQDGKTYSVAEFDSLMKRLDDEWVAKRQLEIETYGDDCEKIFAAYERGEIDGVHLGYAKTRFTLNMPDGTTYSERQDIGDGDGGMIDFLKEFQSYSAIVPLLEQAAALEREQMVLQKPNVQELQQLEQTVPQELSPKEKKFLETDTVQLITEGTLAWDEVESLSYIFFENGYTERFKPSEKALYGNALTEVDAYRLAAKMQSGEDVSHELVKALIGKDGNKTTNALGGWENYQIKYTDNTIKITFGNVEKETTYAETAKFFLNRMEQEYHDIEQARVADDAMIASPGQAEKSAPAENADSHFTFTADTLENGGAKTRFRNNVNAIRTMQSIKSEQRQATQEEQAVLAQYVGWGGMPQAFDPTNAQWSAEYKELQALLDPEDYENARASTLNAHFTSPVVISAIYDGLKNMGFQGGNVLEPAVGIGNFFGAMPEDIRRASNLYGVELDGVTGQIAQLLYPDADIQVKGFEQTDFRNDSFDAAVGNVPFGSYKVLDKEYDAQNFMIHDYFFAKSLDKVKEGGVVAFVTSTGTLDKQNTAVREYLAQRADLLGAIRLPNNAFKANAGTEVTTDILFLQKRSEPPTERPSWVELGHTADGLPINRYFEEHPEMILGRIVDGNKLYGSSHGTNTMCVPLEGADLQEQLRQAVSRLHGQISITPSHGHVREESPNSNLQPFTYTAVDQKILFRSANGIQTFNGNRTEQQRMLGMMQMRDTTRELLQAQLNDVTDDQLKQVQRRLSEQYDTFYKKFGLIHGTVNKRLFSDDAGWGLICSLEKEYSKNKLIKKSDIFTQRTIRSPKKIEHVSNAADALAVSIQERASVDLPYMEELSGLTSRQLIADLSDKIFPVPGSTSTPDQLPAYVIADEYLSGNIREKLEQAKAAAQTDPRFAANIPALEKVMPAPIKAGDIDVQLGATWIPAEYVQQFMYEAFKTPYYYQDRPHNNQIVGVSYLKASEQWNISNKRIAHVPPDVERTYGTKDLNPYYILESALNLKEPKVYMTVHDDSGLEKRVVDPDATRLAKRKLQKIQRDFSEWIFKDPERREDLVKIYNATFNSIRPREYDGSHLEFPGMNVNIQLHSHQKNAIAHALYGGNTLFAHSVGAGKTYEMIATAMEGKRLGLCHKSMFVVPKHLTEQVGKDFQKLYPNANVLVATAKDFKAENRRELMARIATGNYDAVVISHSQFGLLPVSKERQEATIREQINEIVNSIQQLREQSGDRIQIKMLERTKRSLENNLKQLMEMPKDKFNVTFEQLGIDKLFVDEAHEFKNLFAPTKLHNVAGLSSAASKKSMDLYTKCRYLDEITGGKGIVFATGTPISNTITELHTMMRYLQHDLLQKCGIEAFDSWVSTFGKPQTAYELAPAGNKWRQKTRIASYSNLPELISMFKQCADIKTPDTLNLDVPECRLHIVETEPTDLQKDLVAELSDRADAVQAGVVDPSEDNMLRITGDGRKVGLDPRLIDADFEDDPNTKLNQCVRNVFSIWEESKPDRAAQLIFCDLGVPHGKSAAPGATEPDSEKSVADQDSLEESGNFCVYEDIRSKLIEKGIPKEEIAFIHDAGTESKKAALFEKVRNGEVRILLGSTSKLGTGTNVQDRLIAMHDLDVPWRPSDLDQRRGRMVRQGNMYKQVDLYRYVTKGTFDAYSYQTLENKQKFISQIITSKTPARSCEDVDQAALSYAEVKALCTGDERIKEKLLLDNEVKELQLLKTEYNNRRYEMQDLIRKYPERSEQLKHWMEALQHDIDQVHALSTVEGAMPEFSITLGNVQYTDMKKACDALDEQLNKLSLPFHTDIEIGSMYGFPLTIRMDKITGTGTITMHGSMLHTVDISNSSRFTLRRLEKEAVGFSERLEGFQKEAAQLDLKYRDAIENVQQPFQREQELQIKSERLAKLNDQLQEAAKQATENRAKKPQTYYFSRSKRKSMVSRRSAASENTKGKPERSHSYGTECK